MDGGFLPDAWCTAVPDWKDRIRAGRSLIPALPLDSVTADRAERIFRSLRVPDLKGQPTMGEVGEPWLFEFVRALFGSIDKETKARVIREFFLMIAKKNTKTTSAAAIIVTACLMNETPYHEFVLIAPTINIAQHAYKQAKGIIAVSVLDDGTPLAPLFHARDQLRTIELLNRRLPSSIAIKAADTDTVTGFKNGSALIDELHELSAKSNAESILLEIAGALSSPGNTGFMLTITTQSKKAPSGAFKAALSVARDVRDGKLRLPLLPVLYEMPPEDAANDGWRNRAKWGMPNPNLGRSVSVDFLEQELAKADAKDAEAVLLFASQHLNVEVGIALHGESWAGAQFWGQAFEPGLTFEDILERSEVVTIGIDNGGTDDLVSLALIGRERETKRWLHWMRAWAEPEVFERRKSIAAVLRDFEAQGDLVVCSEDMQAAQEMAAICTAVAEAGLLPNESCIGLDQHKIHDVMDALDAADLGAPRACYVGQGFKLQSSILGMPRLLKFRRMVHCGQPIMAWSVGNAKETLVGSNRSVTKAAAGVAKIDPLMATFNAAQLMMLNPEPADASGSYLATSDLLVL